ncbi:phycobilisome degradation protein NblA [Microcystis phage LMM01]|uniref:Phycobilisome degradation protein NblA n=1 Tax=Microcystis phage LMM01 TaxID=2856824 RepID=A0A7B9_9CAUD|nr:phycobilisome degradation protein NblA [Microcystis phage LMM01]BAF36096.1 phycobilisome degradation protein NblA [Microcystis phage LMM01]
MSAIPALVKLGEVQMDTDSLRLEQQLQLRAMSDVIDKMTLEQARDRLKDMLKQAMIRDNLYAAIIKKNWGLEPTTPPNH